MEATIDTKTLLKKTEELMEKNKERICELANWHATATPDGKTIIREETETIINLKEGMVEAAKLYAGRGGFSEEGTKLQQIRKRRENENSNTIV